MYIIGNAVISRIFASQGFHFNDKGLFYIAESDDKKRTYEIFISNDAQKIVELLGINFEDVDHKDETDFFKVVSVSPYFKARLFKEDISEGGSKLLSGMAEFLKTNTYATEYVRLSLDTLFTHFKEEKFEENYKRAILLFKNYYTRKKFDGQIILKNIPDFEKTKLGETLSNFNHYHFPNKLERDYFLMVSTEKDIMDEFLKSINSIKKEVV